MHSLNQSAFRKILHDGYPILFLKLTLSLLKNICLENMNSEMLIITQELLITLDTMQCFPYYFPYIGFQHAMFLIFLTSKYENVISIFFLYLDTCQLHLDDVMVTSVNLINSLPLFSNYVLWQILIHARPLFSYILTRFHTHHVPLDQTLGMYSIHLTFS
jgi:hypothetical protein